MVAVAGMAGCAPRLARLKDPVLVTRRSPEVWKARFETTQGVIIVQVARVRRHNKIAPQNQSLAGESLFRAAD